MGRSQTITGSISQLPKGKRLFDRWIRPGFKKGFCIVNRGIFRLTVLFALAVTVSCSYSTEAQNRQAATSGGGASNLLESLPASDAVVIVKVKRVINEALPKLLSGNPTKLSEANAQIEQLKSRTGVDLRSLDQIALSMRYTYPSPGITKINSVAIATGTLNAGAIVAAGRIAANGKYQEEKYHGKTIYIFTLAQQIRVFGLIDLKIQDLAVCPLDGNKLALGNLQRVREAIDVGKGRNRSNAELIALASRDPSAIAGFGGNISPAVMENLRITNDAIARDLTAVRQVYGTVGMTDKDLELMLAARTVDPSSAKNLGDTIEGLKQFGALFVNRLPAAKGALARSALGNLKITTQGNELQIRTAVAQAEVVPLMAGL